MDMPVNVPVDNPNADTEWNDILRKHGIIPEKPADPEPVIQEALLAAQQRAHDTRLESKDLDDLHELEDEEDPAFLESYRQKRLAELSALQKTSLHGQVYPVSKPEYARAVTEASKACFVLVHLSSPALNVESRVLGELWRRLAEKFADVKFCEIRADLCIEGYPERNTPTILVYRDGDVRRQIVTLAELGGVRTGLAELERMLVQVGAVKENDARLKLRADDGDEEEEEEAGVRRRGLKMSGGKRSEQKHRDNDDDDDDDDDWD